MKAATLHNIKNELKHLEKEELLDLCLSLAKFKKENKELLSYLLFESEDEEQFIHNVNEYTSHEFTVINKSSNYLIKKSSRRILKDIKKYIRYSKKKTTEIELLIHFCKELGKFRSALNANLILANMYNNQVKAITKTLITLHEDLQYDYNPDVDKLKEHPCYRA